MSESIPAETLRRIAAIERDETTNESRQAVSLELTAIAQRLCAELIAVAADAADDVLTIGIHGDGVWDALQLVPTSYHQLVDPARLAEELGKTVIDSFPCRDLAQGGHGGPVETHGLRLLLADRSRTPGRRWRALLNITSYSTHLSILDPFDAPLRPAPFQSIDLCVGSRLISELLSVSSSLDPGAKPNLEHESVSAELEELWTSTSIGIGGWNPKGISPLPLIYALQNSELLNTRIESQILTANHFICRRVSNFIQYSVSPARPIGELLLMGEGSQHACMKNWLVEMLPGVSVSRATDLGKDRTIMAAAVAALAQLHVCQVPVASTSDSGIPRVLGRVTPGSPSNWQRVLRTMTAHTPWQLPVREAV